MNPWKYVLTLWVAWFAGNATAQELLQIRLAASCITTNGTGRMVPQRINNTTLIRQYAAANGVSNTAPLQLVYAVNGDERGDVIELINGDNGTVIAPVFALFFPVDLPNGDGTRLERHTQLFNNQKPESIGTARMSEFFGVRRGVTNTAIHGTLQFYLLPQDTNGLRICAGSFLAAGHFTPRHPGTNAPSGGTNLTTVAGPQ